MIITKTVFVTIGSNQKHFLEKGYDAKYNTKIEVKVEDLSIGSKARIVAKCACGNETELGYDKYIVNYNRFGFYGCRACSKVKRRKTCVDKFGVDSYSKTDEYKGFMRENTSLRDTETIEKRRKTMIERYGSEHAFQSKEILAKSKETFLKKYGATSYMNSESGRLREMETWKEKTIIALNEKGINHEYVDGEKKAIGFLCDVCKQPYEMFTRLLYQRSILYDVENCTNCNPLTTGISGTEVVIGEFIQSIYNKEIVFSDIKILDRKEIDIYLPDLEMAFEYNGLYWHSEVHKDNKYHLRKTELALSKGIQLIHIFEDDWLHRNDIVKSRIMNLLGIIQRKIYARKTKITTLTTSVYRDFIEENHLQGHVNAQHCYGLFHDNELVSVMSFGKVRKALGKKGDGVELLRFCNKLNTIVVGGASKLLKHYIETEKPKNIITYADRSWSVGKLYEKLGFTFKGNTVPGYSYVNRNRRENRWNYRKDVLVREGYDASLTEHQIMLSRKLYRIYDSGNCRYEMNL